MLTLCRRFTFLFGPLLFAVAAFHARAAEPFPFGSELMLDAAPLPGSKRIPMLEIEDDGAATIDLWCTSLRGQATVTDDAITIVPGQTPSGLPAAPCDAQQQAGDAPLLTQLSQMTTWRRRGDLIELSGPTTLRYRLMTN